MPVIINATHKSQQTCKIVLKVFDRDRQLFTCHYKYTIRQYVEKTNVTESTTINVVPVQLTIAITHLVSVKAKAR